LAILAGGEDYGYSIIRRIRDASGGKVEWSEGMLYPVLHRLEAEGLIRSTWKDTDNGRRRKYYRVTQAGRQSLAVHRAQWDSVHRTLTHLWSAL
jgi:DNA-binding PadR family transcriptional regulator